MQHGGDLSAAIAQFGGRREDWLDLSTGINPWSYPLDHPLDAHLWLSLPGRSDLDRLLAVARAAYDVPVDAAVVAAPGTQALIQWLPWLAPEGDVAVLGPTYGEHALCWANAGRRVHAVTHHESLRVARHRVLVHPNNPDGAMLDSAALQVLAEDTAAGSGWLIIDESFVDTMPDRTGAALAARWPVIVLRSFGKFYGLAGLRLGFAIAGPEIASRIGQSLGPWAVAGPALGIGARALADKDWAVAMRERLEQERAFLDHVLNQAGLDVVGGTMLYRLARHDDAWKIHRCLAENRIWIRRFEHDPQLLRFGHSAAGNAHERLAAALRAAVLPAHASPRGVSTVSPSTV